MARIVRFHRHGGPEVLRIEDVALPPLGPGEVQIRVTALGLTLGLAGALALNRLIASLLFGVQPTDTVTIAFVIATITAVAVVASWLPAWRASRLDPNVVLRDE